MTPGEWAAAIRIAPDEWAVLQMLAIPAAASRDAVVDMDIEAIADRFLTSSRTARRIVAALVQHGCLERMRTATGSYRVGRHGGVFVRLRLEVAPESLPAEADNGASNKAEIRPITANETHSGLLPSLNGANNGAKTRLIPPHTPRKTESSVAIEPLVEEAKNGRTPTPPKAPPPPDSTKVMAVRVGLRDAGADGAKIGMLSASDKAAIDQSDATAELIVEAALGLVRNQWGSKWLRENKSVRFVCNNMTNFQPNGVTAMPFNNGYTGSPNFQAGLADLDRANRSTPRAKPG